MNNVERLTPVPIENIWPTEDRHLTPWLAKNADLLGETLKMDLVHEGTEVTVGRYRADLVFREESAGKLIVVENMFGATDHDHLGKLLTYAAGLKVGYAVLLAPEFQDEHISALNWLNTISTNDFGFFGLVLKVWRIGDSPPAPQLSVAVQPDNWSRLVRALRNSTPTKNQQAYRRFWDAFLLEFNKEYDDWRCFTTSLEKTWMGFPSSRQLLSYYSYFGVRTKLRVEAYIYANDEETNKKVYDQLHNKKQQIETAVGEELEWDRMDGSRYPNPRISLYSPETIRIPDEDRWPEARSWLLQAMGKMRSAFDPILQELGD